MGTLMLVFLLLAIAINLYGSIFVYRRTDVEQAQKIAQIIVIWIVPIMFAVGMILFYKSEDKSSRYGRKKSNDAFPSNCIASAESVD